MVESSLFSSYKLYAGDFKIKNSSLSVVEQRFDYVSSINYHTRCITCYKFNKLTQNKISQDYFFNTLCVLQDLISGKTIGTVKQNGKLYYFEDELENNHESNKFFY